MPVRERACAMCDERYDVLEHRGELVPLSSDRLECPRCGCTAFEPVFSVPVAIELGGESSVGRHYPYWDRALGPGRGVLVKSAQHRRQLMTHREISERDAAGRPTGRKVLVPREERLVPLDEAPSSSRTIGVWDDIATRAADEAKRDETAYNVMVTEMTSGPNREAYARAQAHAVQVAKQGATDAT